MASMSKAKSESKTDRSNSNLYCNRLKLNMFHLVPNIWYCEHFKAPNKNRKMRISEVIKEVNPPAIQGVHTIAGHAPRLEGPGPRGKRVKPGDPWLRMLDTHWTIPEKIEAHGRIFIRCVVFKNGIYYDMIRLKLVTSVVALEFNVNNCKF